MYVNDRIGILRAFGIGCFIGPKYFGIVVYADDILLIALRRDALRRMVDMCESYMINHKISFSTAKTKCFCFGVNKDLIEKITVAGVESNWSKCAYRFRR